MARKANPSPDPQNTSVIDTYSYSGTGGISFSTTKKTYGRASFKFTGSATDSDFIVRYAIGSDSPMYSGIRFMFESWPAGDWAIMQHLDSTDTTWRATIVLTSSGTLKLQKGNVGATQIGSASAALELNKWYAIDLKCHDGDSTEIEGRVNGQVFASGTDAAYNFGSGVLYFGSCNNVASGVMYCVDIAVNDNTAGGTETGYPDPNRAQVVLVPAGAGDNNPTAGNAGNISEFAATDTCTAGGSDCIEMDTTTTIADFTITNPKTLGMRSMDKVIMTDLIARVREETAGTSNYALGIKSASGGTVTETSLVDAGNTTVRSNPSGTTEWALPLITYVDPTTGVAWKVDGTNSLTNAQIRAKTTDGNPDIWIPWMGLIVEFIPSKVSPNLFVRQAVRRASYY